MLQDAQVMRSEIAESLRLPMQRIQLIAVRGT